MMSKSPAPPLAYYPQPLIYGQLGRPPSRIIIRIDEEDCTEQTIARMVFLR
jgi:hypothetical protein